VCYHARVMKRCNTGERLVEKMATIKAKDLAPATRTWIMDLLHIDLADEDEFTLTWRRPVHVPSPEERAAARQGLVDVLGRIDQGTQDVPDEEIDAAIDEAMRSAHPRDD